MNFKEAKGIIRRALARASDAKLIEVLEAARAGAMPHCGSGGPCLAHRLYGSVYVHGKLHEGEAATVSYAYNCIAGLFFCSETTRQRIIIPMILAEIRRRNRARDFDAIETVTMAELFGGRK